MTLSITTRPVSAAERAQLQRQFAAPSRGAQAKTAAGTLLRGLAALLPGVLLTLPSAMARQPAPWWTFVLFAVGFLFVLAGLGILAMGVGQLARALLPTRAPTPGDTTTTIDVDVRRILDCTIEDLDVVLLETDGDERVVLVSGQVWDDVWQTGEDGTEEARCESRLRLHDVGGAGAEVVVLPPRAGKEPREVLVERAPDDVRQAVWPLMQRGTREERSLRVLRREELPEAARVWLTRDPTRVA